MEVEETHIYLVFGVAMNPISIHYRVRQGYKASQMSHWHWDQLWTHASYLVPSTEPIVLVVTLQGGKKLL